MTRARSCPICADPRARAFWAERATAHVVVRCVRCGCVYSDLSLEQYAAEQHNAWNEPEVADEVDLFYRVRRERVHLDFLADIAATVEGRRVLDIGCGLGVFLERAAAAGWAVHGIDTSEDWVRAARGRVGEDAVELGAFETSRFAGERFDLITLWDVIEHVWDPVPLLRAAAAALAPGGRLFIRTPNIRYVAPVYGARRRLLREDIDLGATNHVIHFSSRSLGRALRDAGLGELQWRTYPPPQVPLAEGGIAGAASVQLKNAIARSSDLAARASAGRLAFGSDLDVIAGAPR
ncbi:MAG: class I SAM-dependent methyltransferase [Solirubrobacteraceae bacterium]|nr:class I SAM-dependent methyltransferase [Patulibacter sp.]